jgi:hypothetical protein
MKKLLFIGALLCVLCSCGSGNSKKNAATANVQWVDLGLSSGLKWATCNIGASCPADYGNYYTFYDAVAIANWGDNCRLPTYREFRELIDDCLWTWTIQDDHTGYQVTGPNGNSIFLPAAGGYDGANHVEVGLYGYYWSTTQADESCAMSLQFIEGHLSYIAEPNGYRVDSLSYSPTVGVLGLRRHYGVSVRPVLAD